MDLPVLDRDLDTLRRLGGLKWTMFPDAIGAFVAEMDFGTAPPVTAALHAAVDAETFGYLPAALAGAMAEAYAAYSRDTYGWVVDPASSTSPPATATSATASPTPAALTVVPRPARIAEMMRGRGEQDQARPVLKIIEPRAGATVNSSTVKVRLALSGDLKGYQPMMDPTTKMGNHVHVILDNQPYEAYYNLEQPFELRNVARASTRCGSFRRARGTRATRIGGLPDGELHGGGAEGGRDADCAAAARRRLADANARG